MRYYIPIRDLFFIIHGLIEENMRVRKANTLLTNKFWEIYFERDLCINKIRNLIKVNIFIIESLN